MYHENLLATAICDRSSVFRVPAHYDQLGWRLPTGRRVLRMAWARGNGTARPPPFLAMARAWFSGAGRRPADA